MSRTILSLAALTFLSLTTAHASPQLDFDEIFGGANSTCSGTSLAGHCCPGSIINPSGDLLNNNNDDVSGVICCVGDPSHSFNNGGASTCSAGRAVPLTEVSGAAGTASAAAGSASGVVASTSAGVGMSMSSVVAQSSVAGSAQATQTGSQGAGAESGSAASSGVPTQSSAGGAGVLMATLAPALGGVVIGVAGLL